MVQGGIYLETNRMRLFPMTYHFVSRIIANDLSVYDESHLIKPNEWPEKADIKDVLGIIRDSLHGKPEPDGFDCWLFVSKADNSIVGDGGFKGSPDEKGTIDMGYAIIETQRNKGLGFEAASALLTWGLSQNGVNAVTADCLEDNIPSIKLLSKLGMKETKRKDGMIFYTISNSK